MTRASCRSCCCSAWEPPPAARSTRATRRRIRKDTRALLETKDAEIKSCYDAELKKNPKVGGTVGGQVQGRQGDRQDHRRQGRSGERRAREPRAGAWCKRSRARAPTARRARGRRDLPVGVPDQELRAARAYVLVLAAASALGTRSVGRPAAGALGRRCCRSAAVAGSKPPPALQRCVRWLPSGRCSSRYHPADRPSAWVERARVRIDQALQAPASARTPAARASDRDGDLSSRASLAQRDRRAERTVSRRRRRTENLSATARSKFASRSDRTRIEPDARSRKRLRLRSNP